MSDDRPGDDGLSCPERDAMVAALLGITPDRLRTIRRVHSKRAASSKPPGTGSRWWQCVDQLDDDALFAAVRRREVRARAVGGVGAALPIDRRPRRALVSRG
jgi:hypothetical protein